MNWTAEQEKVITTRKQNILVSAAAGSGKTAVLVARIMARILDPDDPINIDELLIVTFTRAAAGEMKERLQKAVTKAREEDPDNLHLAEQAALIHNAQITTIDGFCSYVLRNYGYTIGIIPGFRVAEPGEVRLMEKDAAGIVLEEAYEDAADEFLTFTESFAYGKSDANLEELILRVYHAAMSTADPDKWLRDCMSLNDCGSAEDLERSEWMRLYLQSVRAQIKAMIPMAEENLRIAGLADGPQTYLKNAEDDVKLFQELAGAGGYEELRKAFEELEFSRLSTKKAASEENPALREQFRNNRERLKKVKDFGEELSLSLEAAAAGLRGCKVSLNELITLTRRFTEVLDAEKKKRNIMDFSDVEHAALRVLRDDGGRTACAKELAGHFREVMCDEYQDSNYLQEAILTAVSRIEDGEPNYFCVGDVKQSIYSFRQARPELFMSKFDAYHEDPEMGCRIDLHRNFRSRTEVIESVNAICSKLMLREIGGVEYDADAALVKGSDYEENNSFETEIMPVFVGEKDAEGIKILEDTGAAAGRELEARAVGERILRMVGHELIRDDHTREMRPVRFSDIVLLMRSVKGNADEYVRVLSGMGIPVYSDAKSGYFEAQEVQIVLSYLEIVDNPRQDIPFAAVLRSEFCGLDARMLANIRACKKEPGQDLYDAARCYAAEGGDYALRSRLQAFFEFYDDIRAEVLDTPLHELIDRILSDSGYRDYAAALPGGVQRSVNLRMLVDTAAEYERTSYIGLFNFVRYIRTMEEREADPGEISLISESEDVVRIYSIHKSKGLEYPVVFVTRLGTKFNLRDESAALLIHPDLGIACDYVDLEHRIKYPTLRKSAVRSRMHRDTIGEELRVLYVALTRAKQKLILVGTCKDEGEYRTISSYGRNCDQTLPSGLILQSANPFAWILMSTSRLFASKTQQCSFMKETYASPSGLAAAEVGSVVRREDILQKLIELRADQVRHPGMRMIIEDRFSYCYPYSGRENVPVEISVSEIKHRRYEEYLAQVEESSEQVVNLYPQEIDFREFGRTEMETVGQAETQTGGRTAAQTAGLTGAERGTAYHRVMELLDFAALEGLSGETLAAAVEGQKRTFSENGKMEPEAEACVRVRDVCRFVESELGARMIRAAKSGVLFREQPFVLAMKADEIRKEWPGDEEVYVQGIIDAFFFEDGKCILLDYKTDRVYEEEELRTRYAIQLETYAKAIEQVVGRPVTESLIWSFSLKKMLKV